MSFISDIESLLADATAAASRHARYGGDRYMRSVGQIEALEAVLEIIRGPKPKNARAVTIRTNDTQEVRRVIVERPPNCTRQADCKCVYCDLPF